MAKDDDSAAIGCMAVCGFPVLFALIIAASIVPNAYVFQCYWGWFIQPLGVTSVIDFGTACGLMAMLSFFKSKPSRGDVEVQKIVAYLLLTPPMYWMIGWSINWLRG